MKTRICSCGSVVPSFWYIPQPEPIRNKFRCWAGLIRQLSVTLRVWPPSSSELLLEYRSFGCAAPLGPAWVLSWFTPPSTFQCQTRPPSVSPAFFQMGCSWDRFLNSLRCWCFWWCLTTSSGVVRSHCGQNLMELHYPFVLCGHVVHYGPVLSSLESVRVSLRSSMSVLPSSLWWFTSLGFFLPCLFANSCLSD